MPVNTGGITPPEGLSFFPLDAHPTLSGIIIGPMVVVGLQFLLYGFYIMVFAVCMMVLKRRNKTPQRVFHFTLMVSLFVLATIGLGNNTALAIIQAVYYSDRCTGKDSPGQVMLMVFHMLPIASTVLTMMANILADVVLVFRCYALWDFRKSVIIVPTIACVVSNVLGILSMAIMVSLGLNPESTLATRLGGQAAHLEDVYYIMNAFINIVLTSMVARRIGFSGAYYPPTTGQSFKKRYASISSIILQSGLVYPLVLVMSVPFTLFPALEGWDVYPLLIQVAGICPTLMIVRVGLGVGVMAGNSSGSFTLNVSGTDEQWRRSA
ncbi:hypothetical protein E1B28_000044 [Marasmius oreades]|uniref:Uncharacterized protein n=1 Tax=Marasmius oreades TaxID=181124 RepID=A0A9P8AE75_9AGAR|nr:uncharacterized protein E1B28_000044 [Marasmius oreades]KAG7098070.1 hypothetical protein E1B28_000044 [Marasmius oreades]